MPTVLRAAVAAVFLVLAAASAPSQTFTKLTTGAPVTDLGASRSAHWIDYDRDGDLDLFVSRGKAGGENNILYRNDGGTEPLLTPMTGLVVSQDGAPSDGATWGDYDNDGDDDLFVVNWYGLNNMLYRNDAGSFTRITAGPLVNDGGYSETASWGDYDNDGLLDLAVSNSAGNLKEFLYHNEGGGSFTAVSSGAVVNAGGESRGVNWVDYDGDGDLDLFVANESNQNEFLFRNMRLESGVDTFQRVTTGPLVSAGGWTWSGSWGDYDDDGDLDVFVANNRNQNNGLFNNLGGGTFSAMPTAFGDVVDDSGFSAASAWVDADNDGDLDLYVSNAYGAPNKNFYYRNLLRETGGATFERELSGAFVNDAGYTYGFSWGDYDGDGDLDLYCARTLNESQTGALYRNDGNANHWLDVDCRGTLSNGSAIGARIRLLSTIGGTPVWQLRVIEGQQGYCVQTLRQHFGLGDQPMIDSLVIEWPSGAIDRFSHLRADRVVSIAEGTTIVPELVAPAPDAEHQLTTQTFRWRRSLLGGPYDLEVASDSTFNGFVVARRSGVQDTAATVDSLPNTSTLYWRVRQSRGVDTAAWSGVRKFVVGASTYHMRLDARWNLVSVPVEVASLRAAALFPGSGGVAYAYGDGSYTARETLATRRGYWLRSGASVERDVAGAPLPPETLAIAPGWNIIAAPESTVASGALQLLPEGLTLGPLFAYRHGYVIAETLEAFRGYWLRASSAGAIVYGAGGGSSRRRSVVAVPDATVRMEIEDAAGHHGVVVLRERPAESDELLSWSPPPPPADGFDARFSDGSLLGTPGRGSLALRVRGAVHPVRVRWAANGFGALRVLGGGESRAFSGGGTLTIRDEREELLLEFADAEIPLAGAPALEQNYPNPFNPATTIAFAIPREAAGEMVELDVFDLLGRRVALLARATYPAGRHVVAWDTHDLPGGVYYCRLRWEGGATTRRMLLMR